MRLALVITSLFLLSGAANAQETGTELADKLEILTADSVDLNDFLWRKRVVIVFADSPADPRFDEQLELLQARPEPLVARDVVVIADSDRSSGSAARAQLRPRGFMWVLLGKDGTVALRKPAPWDVRELSRSIDKMPLRQQELRADR